ncbi:MULTISPECIES: DNA/RNA non-specific endonuclease [unclassified Bacteroides]|jgi:endonuclease G|uniref:DNA/RNA non-specific endonuclease n=1 Tax=unclassified Bacteroides TaxID=2646097 RepID=UPI000E90A2DF|nr:MULTISPECIES: DNA/RNA non-specific endonuclease [unclassified Bacteroides]RGN49227.1 DNA/RNA non-specific endonuclease [Bacteroides sp. OM05-12]RHR83337.1 DNA/RNA non-specific endonuclease [Bacteroides sp. AF16-49]
MAKKKGKRKSQRSFSKWLLGILIIGISTIFATQWKGVPLSQPTTKYEGLEIPARLFDHEEQIIHHTGYSVSYNELLRLPNWVGYELTREKITGTVARAKHFQPDPLVQGISADNQDYSHSGYDRGHMAPAADMKWSTQAMKESFYFSNICPQLHNLNAGDWKELEEKVREWAQRDSAIIIVSGPIINGDNPKRIGVSQVAVPDAFYKVILAPYLSTPRAIGFIMKHQKGNHPLRSYAVSVDSIESLTGIDFFPELPDAIEKEVEAKTQPEEWGL